MKTLFITIVMGIFLFVGAGFAMSSDTVTQTQKKRTVITTSEKRPETKQAKKKCQYVKKYYWVKKCVDVPDRNRHVEKKVTTKRVITN